MRVIAYEIIKEYVFSMEKMPHLLKGRIMRKIEDGMEDGSAPYRWQCSHNHKPLLMSGVYFPKSEYAETEAKAYSNLSAYVKAFAPLGASRNPDY